MDSSATIDSRADPYGRLLQRLVAALHEADSLARLSDRPSVDMEVRGLSAAELALITAYLASGAAAEAAASPPFVQQPVVIGSAAQRPPRGTL